jgi:hypothetical protein
MLDTPEIVGLPVVVLPVRVMRLLAFAGADMTIVVPVKETMVVLAGMLVPVMGWVVASPVRLETLVIVALLKVRMPVGAAAAGVAVTFCDSVMVVVPTAVM